LLDQNNKHHLNESGVLLFFYYNLSTAGWAGFLHFADYFFAVSCQPPAQRTVNFQSQELARKLPAVG